jgi:hypothetical protein
MDGPQARREILNLLMAKTNAVGELYLDREQAEEMFRWISRLLTTLDMFESFALRFNKLLEEQRGREFKSGDKKTPGRQGGAENI